MALKARRALLATDGTIYCNAGTVLEDDDLVAARNMNAVVGSNEPVTKGYRFEPHSLAESVAAPVQAPEPDPEPEPEEEEEDDWEDEEEDEGVDL